MRILITGIAGFVGSHLTEHILEKPGCEIWGVLKPDDSVRNLAGIKEKISCVEGDLLDEDRIGQIVKEVNPQKIFHLAAQPSVTSSFEHPRGTIELNILGTLHLFEAVRKSSCDPVIHICSSGEVYGYVDQVDQPITEDHPFRPVSPYALSKVGQDLMSYQYHMASGLKTVCSRSFNQFGPRQEQSFVVASFALQISNIEKGRQEPVIRVGDLDVERSFLDVRDVCRAYWLLTEQGTHGEVYNIGSPSSIAVREILSLLLKNTDKEIQVEVDPALLRPSDPPRYLPSIDKFMKATGWKPEIPLEQSLRETLDYWRQREDGLE